MALAYRGAAHAPNARMTNPITTRGSATTDAAEVLRSRRIDVADAITFRAADQWFTDGAACPVCGTETHQLVLTPGVIHQCAFWSIVVVPAMRVTPDFRDRTRLAAY